MRELDRLSGRGLLILAGGLLATGLLMLAIGAAVFAVSRADSTRASAPRIATGQLVVSSADKPASKGPTASWVATASTSLPSSTAVIPGQTAAPSTGLAPAPPAVRADAKLVAYRGLGTWVDIYDDRAWRDPAAAVADMASHGVRTLYLETGNSRSEGVLFKPGQLRQFITAAHARDMKVVAWYLPDLLDLEKDYGRIDAAIRFKTADGQGFDSFALDIESGAIKSQKPRNRSLLALSRRIRAAVGPSYPLGAIIPSPVGLSRKGGYWVTFPYTDLAPIYDVFVPMGYYTYHGDGAKLAYSDTVGNARILRAQKGCSEIPIHMIGGEAEKSSTAEVNAFVRGAQETGCIGASLYGWAGTKAGAWQALKGVGTGP